MEEETGSDVSFSGIGNATVGKEGRNLLWEEAMETTAVSGSVAGVRNITLLGVARYVWVRCIIWQSLDGKIN